MLITFDTNMSGTTNSKVTILTIDTTTKQKHEKVKSF